MEWRTINGDIFLFVLLVMVSNFITLLVREYWEDESYEVRIHDLIVHLGSQI